jgi:hypothetical protein
MVSWKEKIMDFYAILGVAFGLVFMYYVLSQIASSITSWVGKILQISAQELRIGLSDLLGDSGKFDDLMEHPWMEVLRPKAAKWFSKGTKTLEVDWIPPETFAKILSDVLAPKEPGEDLLSGIIKTVAMLPPGKAKTQLGAIMTMGVQNIEGFQKNVVTWFNDAMNGVSQVYTQRIHRIVILISFVMVAAGNLDSIAIGKALWQAPATRELVVSIASARMDAIEEDEEAAPDFSDISTFIEEFEAAGVPMLWRAENIPTDAEGWGLKILGLVLTGAAASMGSSFWYDILKRIRGVGGSSNGDD